MRDVIIIGSGPAGFTAAIYAARANLAPLLIASSVEVGGELMQTTEVENFPGFPEGIMGPDLMDRMQKQAEKFGTEIVYDDVTGLDIAGPVKKVTTGEGQTFEARALIYATGSAYRKLGCERETELSGRGISWCATCDGAFFRDRRVAVIGGGDSAIEEATFLSRFASRVTVIHRRDALRASAAMIERAQADPKIDFRWNTVVSGFLGDQKVTGVTLTDTVTGASSEMPIDGVFEAIGSDPRTHLVHGLLELTAAGTIAVEGRSSRTSVPGVFAAGDVVDATYRQAATAAGSGVVAALDAQAYLAELDDAANAQIGQADGNTATGNTQPVSDVVAGDKAATPA
ncbi:MAG: thioredoxin-disulfide reductase [Acidipropionibacterium sp.]|jgi:thioredoxin reductase (NADPH)|nr:thioredoxin-disulfide reductase [Acidipropionibacterium sp.]